ncbi:MAG: Rpn family recombination-promoting nuclease/putative transposase [Bacteroidota bacterium]
MNGLKERYVNPLTDYGFKKLFGTEPNKALLIDFLNQILPLEHKIQDLHYTKAEQLGLSTIDRSAIFDLYCISESGQHFIVEMQKAKQDFFKDRSVYYASFPIQEMAQKGSWDFTLSPIYTVGILDFIFDDHKDDEDIVHTVELKNQHCKVFYNKLKFIYIQLPKFKKSLEELETQFDKWLYVFKHLPDLENRPEQLKERVFSRLFEAAEIAQFSREERWAYEHSLKVFRDLNNVMESAVREGLRKGMERGMEKGRKEGLEKGLKEGIEEGIKKGMEQGMERGIERGIEQGIRQGRKEQLIAIAKAMKQHGAPAETIRLYTQLSKEDLQNL